MPRPRKPPGEAIRQNKESQYREVAADPDFVVPDVPPHPEGGREWHEESLDLWRVFWTSPLQAEIMRDLDIRGFLVAMLAHDLMLRTMAGDFDRESSQGFIHADRPKAINCFLTVAKEYGVTPMRRRQLGVVPAKGGPKGVVAKAGIPGGVTAKPGRPDPRDRVE